MDNKDQSRQEHFAMIRSWQQSGLSQKAYCQVNNIKYHVFHYWYKTYRDKQPSHSTSFIPLHISDLQAGYIELQLTDGRRIVFHQPIGVEYLKALIA
jgi:hypothetical protein